MSVQLKPHDLTVLRIVFRRFRDGASLGRVIRSEPIADEAVASGLTQEQADESVEVLFRNRLLQGTPGMGWFMFTGIAPSAWLQLMHEEEGFDSGPLRRRLLDRAMSGETTIRAAEESVDPVTVDAVLTQLQQGGWLRYTATLNREGVFYISSVDSLARRRLSDGETP